MSGFRRWYFYVVSGISLQAVTWALIALLRNLVAPALQPGGRSLSPEIESIAFQISVIVIGLPMFLLHWRWAGRLTKQDGIENRDLPERALYLYTMTGAFLIPLLTNAGGFLQSLLRLISGTPATRPFFSEILPDRANMAYTAVAILILALMLLYHTQLLRQDRRAQPQPALTASLHRLFIYLFSAAGLTITSFAAASILQWLLLAAGDRAGLSVSRQLINGISAIIVGLPLWLFFWQRAQELFRNGNPAEQTSLLRKVYLYVVIFLSVIAVISALTALLAGLFRRLLGLDPQAGSGVVFSTLIVGAIVWAYHALVLREDTRQVAAPAEQAGLRRLYRYLIAGVGLLVLLVGLGGVLGILFDPARYVVSRQSEQLAWFLAMLLSGLVVWIIPWRRIQQETAEPEPAGLVARTSIIRRFYLFFFLLLATLTFLIAAIFILSRILLALLGEPLLPQDLRMMGLSAAYAIMAAVVWLYHGRLLQQDRQAVEDQQKRQAAGTRIVVVDNGDGKLGRSLLDGLNAALPGANLTSVGLIDGVAAAMSAGDGDLGQIIAAADIIVGPWTMTAPHAGLAAENSLAAAIAASPARKLILPQPVAGWQWVVDERWHQESAVRQATQAVEQIVSGESAAARALSGPATIIFLVAATIFILILITSLLGTVIPLF